MIQGRGREQGCAHVRQSDDSRWAAALSTASAPFSFAAPQSAPVVSARYQRRNVAGPSFGSRTHNSRNHRSMYRSLRLVASNSTLITPHCVPSDRIGASDFVVRQPAIRTRLLNLGGGQGLASRAKVPVNHAARGSVAAVSGRRNNNRVTRHSVRAASHQFARYPTAVPEPSARERGGLKLPVVPLQLRKSIVLHRVPPMEALKLYVARDRDSCQAPVASDFRVRPIISRHEVHVTRCPCGVLPLRDAT
jgi:hypothetical protein